MKKKNNYLPCDDVQGQQCFDGLENTVRVSKVKPIKDTNKFNNKALSGSYPKGLVIKDSQLERLKKQYRFEIWQFNHDLDILHRELESGVNND